MISAASADFLIVFVWSPRLFCKEILAWASPDPIGGGESANSLFLAGSLLPARRLVPPGGGGVVTKGPGGDYDEYLSPKVARPWEVARKPWAAKYPVVLVRTKFTSPLGGGGERENEPWETIGG